MGKCIYLRQRSKKGIKYLYCVKTRIKTDFKGCSNCLDKEYKKYKGIKKVNKNKEKTSVSTYNKVFTRDKGRCAICDSYNSLHLHHINGRGKGKTDNPNNCIMLCADCHLNVVHKNNKKWRPILNEKINRMMERKNEDLC